MTTPSKRPTAVTVLGWIFIAGGALMLIGGGLGLVSFTIMGDLMRASPPPISESDPWPLRFISASLFRYTGALCLLQLLVATLTIISAANFLRLRAWARAALEAITWLGLIGAIGFGIFWVTWWLGMTARISTEFADSGLAMPIPGFTAFGAIAGSLGTAFYAAPCVLLIWLLRGRTVRQAMDPHPPPTALVRS